MNTCAVAAARWAFKPASAISMSEPSRDTATQSTHCGRAPIVACPLHTTGETYADVAGGPSTRARSVVSQSAAGYERDDPDGAGPSAGRFPIQLLAILQTRCAG